MVLGKAVQVVWQPRVAPQVWEAMFCDSAVWVWSTLVRCVTDWVRLNEQREQRGLQHTLLDKILDASSRLGEFWGSVQHEPHQQVELGLVLLTPICLVARVNEINQVGAVIRSNLLASLQARVKHAFNTMIVTKKDDLEAKAEKLREARKILKWDEVSHLRPHSYKPSAERATCNRDFGREIRGHTSVEFLPLGRLLHAALNQAEALAPISPSQVSNCLQHMLGKKGALDGWSFLLCGSYPA